LINSQQPDKGSILSVRNWRLAVAKENGWKTVGVEPSDKARAIALKKQFLLKTPRD
jgi:hypothetical protein